MMDDGTVIRDGHESHVRCGQGLSSPEPSEKRAFQRAIPGILIFSRRQELLHMNRRALELMGNLNQTEIGPVNEIPLSPLHELRILIQETLDHRKEANIWEYFELKRVIFEAGRKILVRGIGMADRNSYDGSRIVIVLEDVGRRQEHKAQQEPARAFPTKNSWAVS
jgi:hypothetical protein